MPAKRDQFWQYAKEAILSADGAETERDRQDFIDLARTWTQAALVARKPQLAASVRASTR
jgi:hypothetical protein